MRKLCLKSVHELARRDPRVVFLGSDLGFGTLAEFRRELPGQFFMEGVSEANIIGMASGMALEGRIPFVNTIATFITRRAYEQVAVDLCLQDLPVRLIGNGGGVVYAPLGSTHLATEDISIMRALPNMTIVCPADAEEMARFMPLTLDWPHPIYIRLAKGYDPVVTRPEFGFAIGQGVEARAGSDCLAVSTGITLGPALEAADLLAGQGVSLGVLHLPTVKPLDATRLLDLAASVRAVLTVEENTVLGGLGGAVAEVLCEAGFAPAKRFKRLGLPDTFLDCYGSQKDILALAGLDARGIASAALALLGGGSPRPGDAGGAHG